jgi:cyanophycinase-like exopeptidase
MHSPTMFACTRRRVAAGLSAFFIMGVFGTAYAAPKESGSGGGGKTPYTYYFKGSPTPPTEPAPQRSTLRSTVLMGGGEDVHEAFRWMIKRAGIAPGTGGRFVVIRASGADGYDPYVWYSDYSADLTKGNSRTDLPIDPGSVGGAALGLTSMETLVIPNSEAAQHTFVQTVVGRADAIFIAGGDQAQYINYWKGTALQALLQSKADAGTPIGGTSAGLAILGNYDFAALRGSVTSAQAMADPFNHYMTIDPLSLAPPASTLVNAAGLAATITDAHMDERDRMGRLITFVSRLLAPSAGTGCSGGFLPTASTPGATNYARGIGLGIETALLVEEETRDQFYGTRVTNPVDKTSTPSRVYFVRPMQVPTICTEKTPLTIENVHVATVGAEPIRINMNGWSNLNFKPVIIKNGVIAQPFSY